jgi:integrase/recombinase XerD
MVDLLDQLLNQRLGHSLAMTRLTDLTVRELIDIFYEDCAARNLQPRTIEFYRRNLDYLIQAAGDRMPASLTADQLQLLLTYYRQTRGWSVNTVNHAYASWHAFLNFAKAKRVLQVNPLEDVKKLRGPEYLPQPYSDEEIRRMLSIPDDTFDGRRNYAMLLVLADTGIRLGELMGLRLLDVSLKSRRLRVFGKGRKERIVPFSVPVELALTEYQQLSDPIAQTDAFWITIDGGPQLAPGFVTQFHRIARIAGVYKAHIHRFRHTFATLYLRNGGNPLHLQRLLGHTTATMTQRYTHLTDLDAIADHDKASPILCLLAR